MPLNIGSNVNTSRLSFGPATVAIGLAGATPTDNVGLIGEDGVELEFASEMRDVTQGNPKTVVQTYVVSQNFFVRFTSIEWAANRLKWALGSGSTSISGTNEIFRWGGEPCPEAVAVHVQHRKCTAAHTINVRVWRAMSENGGTSVQLGDDPHGFAYAFKALRSTTNWAGEALDDDSQLVEIDIELA